MAHAPDDLQKSISGFSGKMRTQVRNLFPQEGSALSADNHSFIRDDPEEAAAAKCRKIEDIPVQVVKRNSKKEQACKLVVGMKLYLALYRVDRFGDHEDV